MMYLFIIFSEGISLICGFLEDVQGAVDPPWDFVSFNTKIFHFEKGDLGVIEDIYWGFNRKKLDKIETGKKFFLT